MWSLALNTHSSLLGSKLCSHLLSSGGVALWARNKNVKTLQLGLPHFPPTWNL